MLEKNGVKLLPDILGQQVLGHKIWKENFGENDKKSLALVSMGQELSAKGWGVAVGRAGQCNWLL